MAQTIIDTGNHVAGYACKAARAEVIAAYPITPQSPVVEQIADFVERGEMDAKYIRVESEHSAMAACIGAAAAGVRTFTATSAHGLALMHEMLHWASAARLPIVMSVVNRAMGPGWNIWADFSDSLSQRDTGWIQFYCADNQEIFDTIIQAYKLCENKEVMMPAMVCHEGLILSHTSMPVELPGQKDIDDFLPPYNPLWTLDVNKPFTHGSLIYPEWYMEFRYFMNEAMEAARRLIPRIDAEYARIFGREYGGHIEQYRCEDADLVLLSMGTIGSEAKIAVDHLRTRGLKVGAARVRVFRPFPKAQIRNLAEDSAMLSVIDRHASYGMEGPLFTEVKASIYNSDDPPLMAGFIAGLGGRDVTFSDIEEIAGRSMKYLRSGQVKKEVEWMGLRR
ncbi:pyruvate ferredoxin oxidoreductase [Candidatus Bathyarchaeota archaeon]|nr:pyruvate ferredoxin oxidoreductase [Candidatus Bathyarchaeota archaeon]NIU80807.1 pyruvate ferredoxin oxidoreductase [Candidatus Bathyarchaeota archaeon]NIV67438.1 pyruvate ferredoxin oxidoreductase [Candidatus Bathyarchaeota archaeon]NIW15976.1 pyruvate ferredoxin oxidoreductase [Candidatus Bathyarchaeota archaeon]NIW34081.1 pyruvate ferredoxin oxidoreductase [Candidatus Bathyarchaeota archaeon]